MSGLKVYNLPCGKIYVNESPINQGFYIEGKFIQLAPKQVSVLGMSQIDLVHYLISPAFWEVKHQFDNLLKKEGHVDILLDIHDVDRYGDNLMYTILPKGYVQFHPKNVSVDVWIHEKAIPVWSGHPWTRKAISGEKPQGEYSISLDLNRIELKFESNKRCDDILLERAGVKMVNRTPVYTIDPVERQWAKNFFMGVTKPILGVASYSSARVRTWPHMEELVNHYLNHGWFIIRLDEHIEGKYRFTFREMASLMEQCNLVVANDSAALHLAGALRKRVVGIFGHTDGEVFAQNYEKAIIINSHECSVAPCWWKVPCLGDGSYHTKENKEDVKCLKELKFETVLKGTEDGLKKVKKVLAVMLTFNMLAWTKMAVDSIRTFHDLDLLVIDNDSTDGTHEWLTENGIKFLSKRQSVAAAQNMGLEEFFKGNYDYFLLLNNDIALRYDTVDGLVSLMEEHPEYGGMTAQEMPIVSPWLIDSTSAPTPVITNVVDIPTSAYSCTIFNRKCVEDTGRFDEWFTPRYIEDNDYTLRLRLKGWKFGKTSNPIYFHLVGGVLSTDEQEMRGRDLHWIKNIAYYREKWGIHPHEQQNLDKLGPETRCGEFVKLINSALQSQPKVSVLIRQTLGGWGDAIFTTIVAKILKREYGDKIEIHYEIPTKYQDLIRRYSYIDSVNAKKQIDLALNLDDSEFRVEWQEIAETGGIQSPRARLYLNIAGLPEDDFKPDIFIHEDEKIWARNIWGEKPKKVLVVPDGSNALKHWHGMSKVAEELLKLNCNVILSTTKYSFSQICALISTADLVVSPDTGTSNVAGSCDIPVITLFSNRNPEPFERIYSTMIGVQGKCPYSPKNFCDYKMYCTKIEGPYRGKENHVPEPECFKNLGVDEVLSIAKELLGVNK